MPVLMPNRADISKILAACTVLMATAGLSTAVSRKTPSVNTGSQAPIQTPARPLKAQAPSLQVQAREMETLAEEFVRRKKIPGMAMAIVQNGQVLSARGYGTTDVRTGQPVRADSVFRLASLSKAFAATMTGILVEEQALGWDTPVSQQLPSFKLKDFQASQKLTISDILSHQVGLAKNTYDRDLEQNIPYPLLAERLYSAPMVCTPGDCYGYQNIAYSLSGDIVFPVTGDFYSHQVEEKIFAPLGMTHATYGREALMAGSNWAKPHVYNGKAWVSTVPNENYYHVPPAAGVNASIEDMAKWLNAQLGHNPDVLSAQLLEKIQTPQVNTPGELRSSGWRNERLTGAAYAMDRREERREGQERVLPCRARCA